ATGDFVVAWQSFDQAGTTSDYDIYAQRYAAGGKPEGSAFLVNSQFTIGQQEAPAVAMDAAGDFVVAWQSLDQAGTSSGYDIYAQQYRSDGNPEGSAFLVNTGFTTGSQDHPSVAMDAVGDFMIGWFNSAVSPSELGAQFYLADGRPVGPNVTLSNKESDIYGPSVSMDATGDAVMAYSEFDDVYDSSTHTRHLYYGIAVQRFTPEQSMPKILDAV
ncbi:hemolysin-type calcium-binding region, partial [mine drainage metagenome]